MEWVVIDCPEDYEIVDLGKSGGCLRRWVSLPKWTSCILIACQKLQVWPHQRQNNQRFYRENDCNYEFTRWTICKTRERPKPIRGGAKPITISCTSPWLTKLVEIFVIVINIQVEESKEHVTLKFISLAFPHIGIVVEVTMMDIIIHASEGF